MYALSEQAIARTTAATEAAFRAAETAAHDAAATPNLGDLPPEDQAICRQAAEIATLVAVAMVGTAVDYRGSDTAEEASNRAASMASSLVVDLLVQKIAAPWAYESEFSHRYRAIDAALDAAFRQVSAAVERLLNSEAFR